MRRWVFAVSLLLSLLPATPSLARFCNNDPVNAVDPLGLKAYGRDYTGWMDWMDWREENYTQEEVDRVYARLAERDRHIYNPGLGNTAQDRLDSQALLEKALGVPVAMAWNPTFRRLGSEVMDVGEVVHGEQSGAIRATTGRTLWGLGGLLNILGIAMDCVVAGVEKVPLVRKLEPTLIHTRHLYAEAIEHVRVQSKTDDAARVMGWMHSEGAIHGATLLANLNDDDSELVYARTFGAGSYLFMGKGLVEHFGNRSTVNKVFKKDFVPGGAGLDWVMGKSDIHWKDVDVSYVHVLETYVRAHLIDDDPANLYDGIAKKYFRDNASGILGH